MNLTCRLRRSPAVALTCYVLTVQSLLAPLAMAQSAPPAATTTASSPTGTSTAPPPQNTASSSSGGGGTPTILADESSSSGNAGFAVASGEANTFGLGSSTTASKAWANGLASIDPSSGSSRASLPFELVPARGRVQPSLSLEYNSSNGDLEAGVGWGLSLPSIERRSASGTAQPGYYDVRPGGAVYIDEDRFTFAGRPLVPVCLVSGNSCTGASGPIDIGGSPPFTQGGNLAWNYYRLQTDTGSTTRFFWSPDHMTWVVQDVDGNTSVYGVPLDGNYSPLNGVDTEPRPKLTITDTEGEYPGPLAPAFRWNLVRQYDANSAKGALGAPTNPIVYVWNDVGNRHALTDIYDTPPLTPWPALSAYAHHVHLDWQPLAYNTPQNTPTWRAKPSSVLDRVDVTSVDIQNPGPRSLVRRYHLGYTSTNVHTRLQSFQLEGRCDQATFEDSSGLLPATSCLTEPATTMTYATAAVNTSPMPYTFTGIPANAFANRSTAVMDVNNDSQPDLLVAAPPDACDFCLSSSHPSDCCQTCGCKPQTQDLYLSSATSFGAFTHETVNVVPDAQRTDAVADNILPGSAWNALDATEPNESSMTPGIRSFAADFTGDGSLDLFWINRTPSLNGANPCNPPANQTWQTSIFKLFPPSQQTPSWQWSLSIPNYNYSVPSGLEFAWLAAGDIDGDGYIDRMTSVTDWNQAIVPGHACDGTTRGASYVGVERTLAAADGTMAPFDYSKLQSNTTRAYNGPTDGLCSDDDLPWGASIGSYFSAEVTVNYNNSLNGTTTPLPISPPLWLEDMDGDGLEDVVIYESSSSVTNGDPRGAVTYYAGRGDGYFGAGECTWTAASGLVCNCASATGVKMQGSPNIAQFVMGGNPPNNSLPYFIHDVTGDGLADFMLVVGTTSAISDGEITSQTAPWSLVIYPNQDGTAFAATPITVSLNATGFDPTKESITFADFSGSGVDDIAFTTDSAFWVVSLLSGERPLLLDTISNGYGATTTLHYLTTAQLQVAAAATGSPWATSSPQSLDVVHSIETTNGLAGTKGSGACTNHAIDRTTTFVYRDPVYDYRTRSFLGFDEVTSIERGDDAVGDQYVTVDFAIDATPGGYLGVDDPYEGVRGLPATVTRLSDAGTLSLTHTEYNFSLSATGTDGRNVYLVYPEQADEWLWASPAEATVALSVTDIDAPASSAIAAQRTINVPADRTSPHLEQTRVLGGAANIVLNQTDHGVVTGNGGAFDVPIVTTFTWGEQGASGSWIWRRGSSTLAYATGGSARQFSYYYDAAGNETDLIGALSGTLAVNRFSQVQGMTIAPTPSNQSSDGFVTLFHRDMDPAGTGNVLLDHEPDGHCTGYTYDAASSQYRTTTTKFAGALGSSGCGTQPITVQRSFDVGLGVVTSSTDANGAMSVRTFDGLGRLTQTFSPDPTTPYMPDPLPAVKLDYPPPTAGQPIRVHAQTLQQRTAATSSGPASGMYREAWQYSDALGSPLATLTTADPSANDGAPWVVSDTTDVSANGLTVNACQPDWYAGDASQYNVGTASQLPFATYAYDGFARTFTIQGYDRSLQARADYAGLRQTVWDADDLDSSSPHANTPTTVSYDGHGRMTSISQANEGNVQVTKWAYQATGEILSLSRTGGYAHTAVYDTLGRMVANYEPNAEGFRDVDGFPLRTGWRYAYDDAGDLVGTSDPRGCGENVLYDAAARKVAEDYSPCALGQVPYTSPDLASGDGTEAYYRYDSNEPGDATPSATIGRLTSVSDRGAHTRTHYDQRGRTVDVERQLARVSGASDLSARYTPHWYARQAVFDESGEVIRQTTGADVQELFGADGSSSVTASYSARGFVKSASGSYGPLVTATTFDPDGLARKVVLGDAGGTTTTLTYDTLRRLSEQRVAPTVAPPGTPTVFDDTVMHYDLVGNPVEIDDMRVAGDWPPGAKPMSQKNIAYDDLYQLRSITYDSGGDSLSPPNTGLPNALPDSAPSPVPPATKPARATSQAFTYDALGNIQTSTDNANVFFDRSLGTNLQYRSNGIAPNQLVGASTSTDFLGVHYDAAGNVVDMTVQRAENCTAASGACTHRVLYYWDEVNALSLAARWDFEGAYSSSLPQYPALPAGDPAVAVLMTYDAAGQRVVKGVVSSAAADGPTYSAEIFPTLRLDNSTYAEGDYTRDASTETAYLEIGGTILGKVVYDADGSMPAPSGNRQHVFFELPDHLGSTSSVIDKETGDLVERSTYLAYGAADSDYRNSAWNYWEPYRFTGKQADVELGLAYFGARYYSPNLGRWLSPDPLTVHEFGADANPYAYVRGRVMRETDPLGLDDDDEDSTTTTTHGPGSDVTTVTSIRPNANDKENFLRALAAYNAGAAYAYGAVRTAGVAALQNYVAGELVAKLPVNAREQAWMKIGAANAFMGLSWTETALTIAKQTEANALSAAAAASWCGCGMQQTRSLAADSEAATHAARAAILSKAAAQLMAEGLTYLSKNNDGSGPSRTAAGNFAPGKEASHFDKHHGEWPSGMTQEQYVDGARQLLDEPVGGNVLEKTRANGDVLRYNTATGEYASMSEDGTIRTFFRPTDGQAYWDKL